jgi:hypothetical protein
MLYVTPKIKNFLILDYSVHPKDDGWIRMRRDRFPDSDRIAQLSFGFAVRQLKRFYPQSFIHVLTNKPQSNSRNIVYHLDVEYSFPFCKLVIYRLLDEPFMYIDTDIILHRPFTHRHLETQNSFNLFTTLHGHTNWLAELIRPFPRPVTSRYNSGLIWVAQPDPGLTGELLRLREEYLPHTQIDEFLLTLYIAERNLKMNHATEVNHPFTFPVAYPQSTHYWGPDGKIAFSKILE